MRKLLIALFALSSVAAMAAEGVNVYGKVGLDVYSRYDKLSETYSNGDYYNLKQTGRISPSINLELTKDIDKDVELGLGVGYTWHGKRDINYKDTIEVIPGNVVTVEGKDQVPGYHSIPLYVTGKFKFDTQTAFKPYLKADLGYSFNRMHSKKGTYLEYDVKAKNGFYTSVGVGAEYNNIITELAYVYTGAKYKYADGETDKANNQAVRLTVGYKFSF